MPGTALDGRDAVINKAGKVEYSENIHLRGQDRNSPCKQDNGRDKHNKKLNQSDMIESNSGRRGESCWMEWSGKA